MPRWRTLPRTSAPGRRRTLVALAATVALLTACSGSDHGAESATDTEGETAGDAGGPAAGDDTDAGAPAVGSGAAPIPDGTTGEPAPAPELAALGRERVRTAWITLELDDPEAAVDDVTAAAEANGGFVALADLVRDDGTGQLGGTVTVRVPSDALLATLDDLEALAVDAPERRIEEQDVGAELADLRARLTNLTAYEEELRALLTEVREATSDPDDLLPVVERLQSVRSDIDRLAAQRQSLEQRVALSTITVTLTPTPTAAPLTAPSWAPLRTLEEALAATGRALAGLADVAIWSVVTALPVAVVVAGPPLLAWRWVVRRRETAAGGPPSGSPRPDAGAAGPPAA